MNISNFNKCSNCGACYNICPVHAIDIKNDDLFYKPIVNQDICINCGKCLKVCPVNNDINSLKPVIAFAGWHKDVNVLKKSSSGGIFYGLAQIVLNNDGIVYGASYTEDYKKVYLTSSKKVELHKLQKSKYVESEVSNIFIDIKMELENSKNVLFCGTPCQIAGLKLYLGKEYINLLTCDFTCGGLPSHKLYEQYLYNLEEKYNSKILSVDFRPKTHGWARHAIFIEFQNGKNYNRLAAEDPFFKSFLYGKYTVRDYCLECKFSNSHQSDLTIADFWLHKKFTNLDNKNGISLVVCNSEKGHTFLNKLDDNYFLEKIDLRNALYNYKETYVSNESIKKHDTFLKYANEYGFNSAYMMFCKDSIRTIIKNRIARSIFKG